MPRDQSPPELSPAGAGPTSRQQIHGLVRQLSEAGNALHVLLGGQVDTIIDPLTGVPILLQEAQQALLRSEARYRALANILESVQEAMVVTDLAGLTTYWNEAAAALFGYSSQSRLGQPLGLLYADPAELQAQLAEVQAGREMRAVWPARRANGLDVWVDMRVTAMQGELGAMAGALYIFKDISERRQAETAIEQSTHRFQALIENSADVISLLAADGTVLYSSPAIVRVIGGSAAYWDGGNIFSRVHPDEAEHLRALLAGLLQTPGASVTASFRYRRLDETWIWLEGTCTNLLADPAVGAIVANYRDITERKRAEEHVRYSEERLEAIFEQSILSIQVFLPNGAFVRANRAWEHLWGGRREQLVGTNILTDDLGLEAQGIRPYVLKAFAGEATAVPPTYFDPGAMGRVGTPRWTKAWMYPIKDAAGNIREVVLTHEDITENVLATAALQQSEEHFRALIQNSADVVQLVSPQGLIVYVSPSVTRVLGFAPSELVGRPVPELLHPDEFERMQASFMGLLQRPGGIETFEQRARHKDGSWRWIEVTASNLFENPSVRALIINYRDITERKRIEAALQDKSDQLQTMTQQLWHAAKLATLGELAASVAHELNNPLATISLRLETMLTKLPAGAAERPALVVIEGEIERMARLVSELLALGRRPQPQISTLNVGAEVDLALEFLDHHLRQKNIRVKRAYTPGVPAVHADRQLLRQVFLNLLTNAGDAMPRGGELTLGIANGTLANEATVIINIADTGEGIAPEHLAQVWEPFYTTKPEGQGTGLGLAICRRIVQEHGGTISLESQPGQGTVVRLVLPVAAKQPAASGEASVLPPPADLLFPTGSAG